MNPFLVLSSLRSRLIVLIISALVVAQAGSAFLFFDERGLAVRSALAIEAVGRAANIARLIEDAPAEFRPEILRAADSPLVRFNYDSVAALESTEDSSNGGMVDRIRSILGGDTGREIRVKLQHIASMTDSIDHMPSEMQPMHRAMLEQHTEPVELLLSIALYDGGWLNVQTMFHRPPLQYAWGSIFTFFISASLIAAVVWLALGRIVAPLNALAKAATDLGRGEVVDEIELTGPAEVRRLTVAFNKMQKRLTRFVTERTQLLAALGHDLRSPLTAMRLRLELLDDGQNRSRLSATLDEMQTMVEATLAFARGTSTSESFEVLDIVALLSDIVIEVNETGGDARLIADEKLFVRVHPTGVKRALRNIIENAVRYGGAATVNVRRCEDMAEISATDNGPGIPVDKLEDVFSPFVRLENSRSQDTGGIGLGLAIAQTLIHANGGEIRLKNRSEGGLEATILLPLNSV